MIRKRYIACLFALGLTSSMMAQNLEQAKKLFLEGEFEKAKPVFQSLVKRPHPMPIIIIGMVLAAMKPEKKLKHNPIWRKVRHAK